LFSFTRLRYLYLSYFSKPAADRILYRAVRRTRATRILEIGIAAPLRTQRLVDLARRGAGHEPARYAAVDLFEARPAGTSSGVSLKEIHRLLAGMGAQVQLIPGDAAQALARAANSLGKLDLIVISAAHDVASLGAAWFYVPRMLQPGSRVYLESAAAEGSTFRLMPADEIERLAASSRRRAA
jgi:hypothetical protein